MGFEVLKHFVFEIVILLIVLLIGISIITGVNPLSIFYKVNEIFDPSTINIAGENYAQGVDKFLKIECQQGAQYILTLDSVKFYYKGTPSSASDSVNFVVLLDYKDQNGEHLFTGKVKKSGLPVITCGAAEDAKSFKCPQDMKIEFEVRGTGAFEQKEIFHFTTWKALSSDDTTISATAESSTFKEILDSYSSYYLSSFDIVKDIGPACEAAECSKQTSETDCRSITNCYWGPSYAAYKTCDACPSYDSCIRFDNDQCVQCESARSRNCQLISNKCQ
ncbi:MAG: hypothetical protein HY517_02910 [Candidatus Aenigmarchaeota archaeon]|nr:hypothetical protein [Candidatus Aenigmarchaeota archaeon]